MHSVDMILHVHKKEVSVANLYEYVSVKTREFTNYACGIVVSEQPKGKCNTFATHARFQMMPKGCLLCGSNHYLNHCIVPKAFI